LRQNETTKEKKKCTSVRRKVRTRRSEEKRRGKANTLRRDEAAKGSDRKKRMKSKSAEKEYEQHSRSSKRQP
jgi:hypothetical protein